MHKTFFFKHQENRVSLLHLKWYILSRLLRQHQSCFCPVDVDRVDRPFFEPLGWYFDTFYLHTFLYLLIVNTDTSGPHS